MADVPISAEALMFRAEQNNTAVDKRTADACKAGPGELSEIGPSTGGYLPPRGTSADGQFESREPGHAAA